MPFFLEKKNIPAIYLFQGMLGSGKTFMIKKILKKLYAISSNSPTFNYVKDFFIEEGKIKILHFDLYRLQSENFFFDMGFWEDLLAVETICFVEWPEIILENFLEKQKNKPVFLIKFLPYLFNDNVRSIDVFEL